MFGGLSRVFADFVFYQFYYQYIKLLFFMLGVTEKPNRVIQPVGLSAT